MPFRQANGINVYYEILGEGEPIFLISGFATHHETWYKFKDPLAKKYQLIFFDNRGAGQTDAPAYPYTIEMMAEDTVQLMDALHIQQAYMIGSSMGTGIVQTIALSYPERIKKAVLISPFSKLPRASLMKSEAIGKLLAQGNIPLEITIEIALPWLFSSSFLNDPDQVKKKISEMASNSFPQKPEGYVGQLAALQTFDITDDLHRIPTEMLLLAGEEDLSTPPYCAKLLEERLSNATLITMPHVGHMIHAEKTEEVLHLIQEFFK